MKSKKSHILGLVFITLMGCTNQPSLPNKKKEKQGVKPQLLMELPTKYNTPDGATMGTEGNIYISVPNFNNGYLLENKIIDTPEPSCILSIDKNNQLSEWYQFKEKDLHPETGFVGPMDLAFGPDGNLYIVDMQVAYNPIYKSRLIRINIKDGKPIGMDVLVEGFIAANGMVWEENTLFVTESILEHLPEGTQRGILTSGVYAFSLNELTKKEKIQLSPYSEEKQDPHLAIIFKREGSGFGADGIVADHAGHIYTTVSGAIYKTLVGVDNKEVKTELFAEDKSKQQSFDGIVWNPVDRKLYTVGFFENALYAIDEEGNIETLHQNDDTDGTNGLLDQPAEVVLRDNELIIVNMDLGAYSQNDVNTKPDEPYTISKVDLPTLRVTKEKISRTLDDDVFTMLVKFEIPKSPEHYEQALAENIKSTLTEKGNIAMKLYQDKQKPNVYFLYEIWENRAALRSHFAEPWTQRSFAAGRKTAAKKTFYYLTDLKPLPENERKNPKKSNKETDDLIVFFEVKPDMIEVFKKHFTEIITYRRENQDVISYHLYQGKDEPNKFVLYESWKNKEAHIRGQKEDKKAQALFKMLDRTLINGFDLKNHRGLHKITEISPRDRK